MNNARIRDAIAENLASVRRRIEAAASRAGRDPASIQLVAISKTVGPEHVLAAYDLGLRVFGENRVEEAEDKIPAVAEALAAQGAAPPLWHMVGHLQSRKAARALALFALIHSVDSVRLAERLSRLAVAAGKIVPILLELNVSGEASKYGFDVAPGPEEETRSAAFLQAVEQIRNLDGLDVRGLMTMAPIVATPEQARPYFQRLRAWKDRLQEHFPAQEWTELSMGMTDDFEVAIEEGATMLRLGRALFGMCTT